MENNSEWEDITEEEAKASLQPDDEWEDVTEEEAKASVDDEWEDVSVDEAEQGDISEFDSFLAGAGQGASFGFSDEIVGKWKQLVDGGDYEKARDEYRDYLRKASDANPKSALAGDVAGSIGSGLTIGWAVPWANVGTAARLGHAATVAGAEGAISGLGRNEKEEDLAKDVATGAALGAGGGALFNSAGKLISSVKNKKLKDFFTKSNAEELSKNKVSKEVLNEGIEFIERHKQRYIKEATNLDNLSIEEIAKTQPTFARWAMRQADYSSDAFDKILKIGKKPLTKGELRGLKEAGEQGRLTPERYLAFRESEALNRVTRKRKGTLQGELQENFLTENLQDGAVKARQVDDIIPEMQLARDISKYTKEVNKVDEEVSKYISEIDTLTDTLPPKTKQLIIDLESGGDSDDIQAVKKFYNRLFEKNKADGYRMDKLENYVRRSFADNETIIKNLKQEIAQPLDKEAKGEAIKNFKKIFQYKGKINSWEEFEGLVDKFAKNPRKYGRMPRSQTYKSAMERDPKATIPDWAREWDLNKLMKKSVRESVQNKHLRPIGEKILYKASRMKDLGLDDQAKYFEDYANDIMGVNPMANEFRVRDYAKKMPILNKLNDDTMDYVSDVVGNNPYVAHLGLDPRKPLRNIFQPINHTATNMYGSNIKMGTKAMGRLAKQQAQTIKEAKHLLKGYRGDAHSKEIREYIKKGWLPSKSSFDTSMDAMEALEKSGKNIKPIIKKYGDGWKKIGQQIMTPFDYSDKINRVTTIRESRRLAQEILDDTDWGKAAMKTFDGGLTQQVLKAKKYGSADDLIDLITDEMLDRTQFAYNKASRSKLGRKARALNVFQTWPVKVTSEIMYNATRGELDKTALKYSLPTAAAFGIGEAAHRLNPEAYETVFNKEGGMGAAGWTPATSAFGYGSLLGYQGDTLVGLGQTAGKAITETMRDSEYADKARDSFKRKVINSGYLPGVKTATKGLDFIDWLQGKEEEE